MPLRLFRVCRAKHARLDGHGAKLASGRWNSPGRAVVYMVESVSLAVLENLVRNGAGEKVRSRFAALGPTEADCKA